MPGTKQSKIETKEKLAHKQSFLDFAYCVCLWNKRIISFNGLWFMSRNGEMETIPKSSMWMLAY